MSEQPPLCHFNLLLESCELDFKELSWCILYNTVFLPSCPCCVSRGFCCGRSGLQEAKGCQACESSGNAHLAELWQGQRFGRLQQQLDQTKQPKAIAFLRGHINAAKMKNEGHKSQRAKIGIEKYSLGGRLSCRVVGSTHHHLEQLCFIFFPSDTPDRWYLYVSSSFAISQSSSNTIPLQPLKKVYLNANEGERGYYVDNLEFAPLKQCIEFNYSDHYRVRHAQELCWGCSLQPDLIRHSHTSVIGKAVLLKTRGNAFGLRRPDLASLFL